MAEVSIIIGECLYHKGSTYYTWNNDWGSVYSIWNNDWGVEILGSGCTMLYRHDCVNALVMLVLGQGTLFGRTLLD